MRNIITGKIFDLSSVPLDLITNWKKNGEKIVFTNGCFDLIHRGHIHYLKEAGELGDRLVVGLNSDTSVSRLKGQGRPVKNEQNRSEILAALSMVDIVVIFEDDSPIKLIKKILPDILVKGGDWSVDKIVGSDVVIQNGGVVRSLAFIKGESSSSIIESILKSYS